MPEQPVKGDEALRRMAGKALGKSSSSPDSADKKDPLEEAREFTKQMAASAIIESEVAKSQASAEKAKAEAEEAKAKAEKAKSGESGKKEVESGIKAKGEIDLGKFNVQEMLQRQIEDRDKLKEEAEAAASRQQGVSDDLREKLHVAEMEVLKTSFTAQMQVLTKMIETNAARGSFMEQYQATIGMAKELGYSQPQLGGELTAQIGLKKLEFEQNLELRKFTREEKKADREFQRQLKKDDDEREGKREDAKRQAKRDDMFASAPEAIGRALGSAVAERAEAGGTVESKPSAYSIEIPAGTSGEMDCPSCKEVIGIGATARSAVCAQCGSRVQVKRVKEEPVEEERRE